MAFGDHKAILGQLNGDGRIKAYVSYLMDVNQLINIKRCLLMKLNNNYYNKTL